MKNIAVILTAFAAALLCTGCSDGSDNSHKAGSQGAAYEVVTVCSTSAWDGHTGDTLRSIMLEPVPMLNQTEPHFDLLRVAPGSFSGLVQKHRNILILNIGEKFGSPDIKVMRDVYAKGQTVVQISAPTPSAMTSLLDSCRTEIPDYFETAEIARDRENAARFGEKSINEAIARTFGISLNIPAGYKIRNAQQDFMWISYEMPTSSQGIIIYTYPYTGQDDFTLENILGKRNSFAKRIPGPSDGSFMTTVEDATIEYRIINERPWAQVRGFWDVEGDFMGGPFTSFTTVDAASDRVICLDFYVYSPQLPKRNYMRALEHIVYSYSDAKKQD